jgi:uncharacterized protein (DUF305 family)
MKKAIVALGILLVVLLTVVPITRANQPVEGRAGRAEVRFLEGMSDHHQMALVMSNDCLKKAKTDSVIKMCQDIITAQSAEIKQMQDWLLSWYKIEYKNMSMDQMQQMMQGMSGMMSGMNNGSVGTPDAGMMSGMGTPDATMMNGSDPAGFMGMVAGFNRLQGREYELAFLESMIDHHDDAVHMSQRILKTAQHEELRAFAQKIIDDQTSEIAKMETMISELNSK